MTFIEGGVQLNSIPEYAEYQANARLIPEFDNVQLTALTQGTVNELNQQNKG